MSRRTDRRARITSAFEALCDAIGQVTGAAEALRADKVRTYTDAMVEMWLREQGLEEARRDRGLTRVLGNPALDGPVGRMVADQRDTFGGWVRTEPQRLVALMAEAAPGAAGDPPREWLGEAGTAEGVSAGRGEQPYPELWRIGEAVIVGAPRHRPFPVGVPLLDESHLEVRTGPYTREHAESLVETLLMRMVSFFRPGLVAVHVWDVGQLSGAMPGLYPLTRTGVLTVHDPTRLADLLALLSEHIRRVHTRVLVDGHPSLRALADETGARGEPWQIAVLVGNRTPLEEDETRALQRVARNGLAAGVQLVLVDIPLTVSAPVESISLDDRGPLETGPVTARCSMTGPHAEVTLDPPLTRDRVTPACHAISDALEQWRSRVATFDDLLPAEYWRSESRSGLRAPIGFRDGLPVDIALCDSSPHALIGGPSGSGKTNLLFAMIGSMVARYPPDELELYLLDFKEGVSFAQFTPGRRDPSWLPHARLVGININTDREFGLALLRFLAEEMRRRAESAKAHEVTKLEELRRAEDEEAEEARRAGRPYERRAWPRIVAVIDEFQYLFSAGDAVTREAVALLEDVARRGRSQGIHLVLASQDVSGIEAFWGRPAIFEQFVLRMALPRARRVLADLNDEALTLPRWHAVLNHESGIRHGNDVVRVPDATAKGTLDDLQRELWRRVVDGPERPEPPLLFDAGRTPRLSDLAAGLVTEAPVTADSAPGGPALGGPGLVETPEAVLGQLIDVDGSPATIRLGPTPGRNIAVVSSAVGDAAAVLGAAALSLAAQHEPGKAYFTLGLLAPEAAGPVGELTARLRSAEHHVGVVELDGFADLVTRSTADVARRLTGAHTVRELPEYLLLYGVDAASGVLERKDPDTFRTGLDDLRQLLRGGPETGLHVLGWWRSVQRLRSVLSMGAGVDDVGCWVAFDVQGSELGTLAPGLVSWSPRPARALMFDRFSQSRPEVLISPDISPVSTSDRSGRRSW